MPKHIINITNLLIYSFYKQFVEDILLEREKEKKLEEEEMQRFEAEAITAPRSSPTTIQSSHSSSHNDNISTSIISNVSKISFTFNILQISTIKLHNT